MEVMYFLLGISLGSFINMLIYRTEERYGITKSKLRIKNKNRSYCDFCGKQLNWYDNIPIFSWLVLGGKSQCCHKKLPWQYPLVEIGTGILFLITNYELQNTNYWIISLSLLVVTLLMFATIFDLKWMILPDFSTYILIGISLIFFHNWLSGLGSFLFLLILYLVTKGRGMGMGDVKLAIFMGLFLGWPKIILAYYIAFIVGAVVGVVLLILKKAKKGSQIAFGPFLIGGTLIAYFYGEQMLYYLSRWF